MSTRRGFWLVSLMVLVLALSACTAVAPVGDGSTAAAPAAASSDSADENSIVIYTALEDDQLERYVPVFEAAHPDIKVEVVRDSTGIVTAKFLAEKENPQADVIWGLAATSLLVADGEGMLEPYAPAGLERVDTRFRSPNDPPTWVGIDVWMSAFCVNTVEMEAKGLPIPASWEELLDPMYAGLIVMPNPASSGTGFLSVSAVLQMLGEEAGWAYLDGLHANIAQYTHSGSKPCRMAGAGEFPIGISFDYRGIIQAQAGEPVFTVFPTEGSGWDMESNALVKKPVIKDAAKTFLDWAISDPIMSEYAKSYAITSVATGQPYPEGYPADPQAQLMENDFVWAAANREAILAEWTTRYDGKSEPR